jgi:hypothetical protein
MILPLSEIYYGAIGMIYWYEKTEHQVSEDEASKMRQKAMSDSINSALMNVIYNGNGGDLNIAMQKGWNSANQQIEMIENGTVMKHEVFMIGDLNNIDRLNQIQTNSSFRGWVNPYLIDQIKNFVN